MRRLILFAISSKAAISRAITSTSFPPAAMLSAICMANVVLPSELIAPIVYRPADNPPGIPNPSPNSRSSVGYPVEITGRFSLSLMYANRPSSLPAPVIAPYCSRSWSITFSLFAIQAANSPGFLLYKSASPISAASSGRGRTYTPKAIFASFNPVSRRFLNLSALPYCFPLGINSLSAFAPSCTIKASSTAIMSLFTVIASLLFWFMACTSLSSDTR